MTDFAPSTAPYLLPFQVVGLPNARSIRCINGLNALDSGGGQYITFTTTGALSLLSRVTVSSTRPGFLYYNVVNGQDDLFTKTFASSATNTISDVNNILSVNAVPSSVLQLIGCSVGGAFRGNSSSINFTGSNGISLSAVNTSGTINYTVSGSGLAQSSASFILKTAISGYSNAQALGALGTGILKNQTSTGNLSIAVAGVDYAVPNTQLTQISAISPILGRIIVGTGTAWTNLDVGSAGAVLQSNGSSMFWGLSPIAPNSGPYITYTASSSLTSEQNLGALASGLLKNTVTSGQAALTAAINGTDYYGPGFTIPISSGGTGQTTASGAYSALSPVNVLSSSVTTSTLTLNGIVIPMNASSRVAFILPSTCSAGSRYRIVGFGAAGWSLAQNAGQSIVFGNHSDGTLFSTTVGINGGVSSSFNADGVEIVCVVANTTFSVISALGNITIN